MRVDLAGVFVADRRFYPAFVYYQEHEIAGVGSIVAVAGCRQVVRAVGTVDEPLAPGHHRFGPVVLSGRLRLVVFAGDYMEGVPALFLAHSNSILVSPRGIDEG